ncbi:uncharacterized protein SAPINGB_P003956 [Magnusiomyces paraingens]|uniref:Uncharacterized protein n=1 Tax=Magnusiomyces paraingens TaxID=2606893 RepID=A0A5E8BU88_9ASCO|nr:uncharacterized protein SAPINGB_P003956 [Saprochaete ingens]VVT54199.1 unnamed protein product [Saprochaete ingens]
MAKKQSSVAVTATTAIGKPMPPNGQVSSLILPNVLVPYIWPTSPASFCTGVVVGLIVAFLRPIIEFYVDVGASYIAVCMRFILIWGSVAFIAWLVLRVLQQTSAATLVINPSAKKAANQQEQYEEDQNLQDEDAEDTSSYPQTSPQQQLLKLQQQQQQQQSQLYSGILPLPLPEPPTAQQQLQAQLRLQSRSLHNLKHQQQGTIYDISPSNQPPVLQLYERGSPDIEFTQGPPGTTIAYQPSVASGSPPMASTTHLYVPTTTLTSGGQVMSSAASVFSDITLSSGSSGQSSGSAGSANYYTPPIQQQQQQQYNPYNQKAPSPAPVVTRRIVNHYPTAEDGYMMMHTAKSRSSSPSRPSPVRKAVPGPSVAAAANALNQASATSANAAATTGYTRTARAASPVRRTVVGGVAPSSPTKYSSMEPRIVTMEDEDSTQQQAYRPYPSRVQQIQAIYSSAAGSDAPGKENYHPENVTILEKPAGQTAFRMKRRP